MSYKVLARKYRPQDFEEVVGQGSTVRILRNALSRNRVPHAMLFSGVRGVGKTTLARIMAKALNCEEQKGELPCNKCTSCQEITDGIAIDLHEIDGASNRGIQEIRELKENIRFLPTGSRYKIIIIDEVHMLTNEAFNALLKTLEEPPDHVIFMFATTELHKIPVTILSRCQRYELKRVPFGELCEYFRKISEAEKVDISETALEMIGREAAGSVRDGLSLLDQVFSFGGDKMTDEDVREVLGVVDSHVFEKLGTALLGEDLGGSLEILEEICTGGADLKRFTADLLYFIRGLIICSETKSPDALIEASDRQLAAMKDLAGQYSSEKVLNLFDRLLKGVAEMQYATHPRLVLEMTFARAVQSGQLLPISELISKIDELLAAAGEDQPATAAPAVPEKKTPEKIAPEPAPPVQVAEATPTFTEDPQPLEPAEPNPVAEETAGPEPVRDVRKDWDDFVAYVKDRKGWMAQVLKLCLPPKIEGEELRIRFDEITECRILLQTDNLKSLTEFAQDFFQKELKVKVSARGGDVSNGGGEQPDLPQEERRALVRDPLVQMTAEIFNGHVGDVRTGPRSREVKAGSEEEI
jgi:DNA polymerase-3 subunit gamma/tau